MILEKFSFILDDVLDKQYFKKLTFKVIV